MSPRVRRDINRVCAAANCDGVVRVSAGPRVGREMYPPVFPMNELLADGWVCKVISWPSPKLYRDFHLAQRDFVMAQILGRNSDGACGRNFGKRNGCEQAEHDEQHCRRK